MPNAALIVKDETMLGIGANGSTYHRSNGCERVRRNILTGEGYDLCEGCHPKNHGELRAIEDARGKGQDTQGSDLYLWGHWWCCEPCWDAMLKVGIKNVFLLEKSEELFNKQHPNNIIGRQFAGLRRPIE
jgi:deoxycytidylate deaminase